MKVAVMDCDVFCLANMLMECIPVQAQLLGLLHVGASSSQIVLYQGGSFVDSFSLPFGGQHYTNRIRETLSCDWQNAETFKIYAGLQTAQVPVEVHHVIDDLNEEFAQHVMQALYLGGYATQSYQGQPTRGMLQGLILSGGGAPTLGLAPSLQHLLATPTQVFNPLRSIPLKIQGAWQQLVMEQGHLFGPALGLALRKTGDHVDATS
jgi:Tfp pilus assembly PilM family ATPase